MDGNKYNLILKNKLKNLGKDEKLLLKYIDFILLKDYSLDIKIDFNNLIKYLNNKKFNIKKFGLNKIKIIFNKEWKYLYN